jgi:glycosyltransferase involved in cell wall biosynthesis
MGRIKVVHICDKFGVGGSTVHGCSRLFSWWMPRFDSRRFDVKLYGVKCPDAPSRALEAMGVGITYLGHERLSPAILAGFLKLIRREKPEVLHLHGWIAANFGRIAGSMTGVPTIMHEHGVEARISKHKCPKSQRMMDFLLSPLTHTALAITGAVRDFLVERRFVNPAKVRIIYNGIPLDDFVPAAPEEVARERERLGIPPGCPVIGTVARLDVQKGVTYLVQSMKHVLAQFPDARFIVVGDGPEHGNLANEARGLGVERNVIFTGYRADVPLLQSVMDIQVLASLWEAASLTIFEAMAMGKAIISTEVDGLGEILEDGSPALTVPPADPVSLGDAIIYLLEKPDMARELASRAKAASRKYDVNRTVRDLESLYEELRAGSQNRRHGD